MTSKRIGKSAKKRLFKALNLCYSINADLAATRKVVDHSLLPYRMQVGLTGNTISSPVYVAMGVSGAVHHIAGMASAGTVIAVNPDKKAPIFEYADFGIVDCIEDVLSDYT